MDIARATLYLTIPHNFAHRYIKLLLAVIDDEESKDPSNQEPKDTKYKLKWYNKTNVSISPYAESVCRDNPLTGLLYTIQIVDGRQRASFISRRNRKFENRPRFCPYLLVLSVAYIAAQSLETDIIARAPRESRMRWAHLR